jgi:putative sugar O-methyltransferase
MPAKPTAKKSFGKRIAKSVSKFFHDPDYLKRKLLRQKDVKDYVSQANRSISDNGRYIRIIKAAVRDPAVFSQFKLQPDYREILEHVTPELGQDYLDIIRKQSPDFVRRVDRFKINDQMGSPLLHDYAGIGTISPSTLRYMKVASDLELYFGDLTGAKIAEIGVGYGGQCLVYDQVTSFRDYHLYDLAPVLDLVAQYLECHLMNGAYKISTLNRNDGNEEYDLVISNYAFSELPVNLQRKYIEKILSRSKRGYLTMNSGRDASGKDRLSLEQLGTLLPAFEVIAERPITGPDNYILLWGHRPTHA